MVQIPQPDSIFGYNEKTGTVVVNTPQYRVWGLNFDTPDGKVFIVSTTLANMMHEGTIMYRGKKVPKQNIPHIMNELKSNLENVPEQRVNETMNTYRLIKSRKPALVNA